MPKGNVVTTFLRSVLIFCFSTSLFAAGEDYRTAAEIDWKPRQALTEAQRNSIPYYCSGTYISPTPNHDVSSDLTQAEADNAIHIVNQTTTMTGNVILNQGTGEVHAPKIVQDYETQIAEIEGPLQMRDTGLLMTGEHATTHLIDGSGTINKATFLLHESHFRGNASTLDRDADHHIFLDSALFTRCEPGSNTWSMKAETMELLPEAGYGVGRNVTIRVKDVPIIYTPYIRFPLNDKRQSGFLLPSIGHDSDGGTDIAIPYYFNLAPNYDATYQLRSLWKRGLIHDGQFRFMTEKTHNEINAGYIHNDKEYDDRDIEDLTSAGTNTGVIIPDFEERDRWYINLRHEGGWSPAWRTSLNYSSVSDIDYLHDIGGEIGSSSVEQFLDPVDTSFANRRSASLDRIGKLQYQNGDFQAALTVQGFQSLDPAGAEQYEKLPNLNARWSHEIGPLDSKLIVDYSFFDKNNSGLTGPLATIGERAYTDFSVAWPYRKVWGFVEPSVGVIHRKYQLDDSPTTGRNNPEETTGRFSLDSGLYFDRYFTLAKHKLQQTLEPRLYYLYVENDYQDDLPQFDASKSTQSFASLFRSNRFSGYDRIGDADRVSLGVTSRFLNEDDGSELFSIAVGQIYYLKDRDVIFQPTLGEDPTASESPLFTEARINVGTDLTVFGTYEWDPDVNRSNRGTFSLKYSDGLRRILNINYTFTASEIQQPSLTQKSEESDITGIWPITSNWSAIGRWNYGWDDGRTIESFFGLEYNDCCWKARLLWRRFLKDPRNVVRFVDDPANPGGFISFTDFTTPSDVGFFVEFQLKGLANLGGRLDSLLEDAIPGYREREDIIGL